MVTINQPLDQDTAILVVEEMGHTVHLCGGDLGTVDGVNFAGNEEFEGIPTFDFPLHREIQVTDARLAVLNDLPDLHWLALNHTQITDAALARLKSLAWPGSGAQYLDSLNLNGTRITAEHRLADGDIVSFEDVTEALAASRADGVMIGRGACGRPWFIGQVMEYLRSGHRPADPSLAEQLQDEIQRLVRDHLLETTVLILELLQAFDLRRAHASVL